MNSQFAIEPMPEVLTVDKYALKQLLDRVKNAVPSKAGRHSVTSVKFESDGTKIRAVASDGFRIAFAEARVPLTKFPPYERAGSLRNFKTTVTFPAHSLRTALFQLKPAIDRQIPAVTFNISKSQVTVSAGDAEAVLTGAKVSGKNNKVRINPAFLDDFLSQVGLKLGRNFVFNEEVTMEMGGTIATDNGDGKKKKRSILVRFSNGPEYVHLIMPLLPEARKVKRVP